MDKCMENAKPRFIVEPLVIGVTVNAMLYGACLLQFIHYCESKSKDHAIIKTLVGWTLLLDTFHTASLVYMLCEYFNVDSHIPGFICKVLWPFSATPIVTTLTSFPIQVYLSWRIKVFSGSMKVFVGLVLVSALQAIAGAVCSLVAFRSPNIMMYHHLIPYVDIWQSLAVLSDGSITLFLTRYLNMKRTGQAKSDSVVMRVTRLAIETAAFAAFFCIGDLITFTVAQKTNFHVIFAFPLGRIYTNTLLMTLNARSSLREELEQPPALSEIWMPPNLTSSIGSVVRRRTGQGHNSSMSVSVVYNTASVLRVQTSVSWQDIQPLSPVLSRDVEAQLLVQDKFI